ncbi:MAG: helix-turn-helix transcriptional regulator [Lachnospira sp.]|nr:helix-turn-helix transcriptional regulator [Lachnospira sp.]
MNIEEACRFLTNIELVPITLLDNEKAIDEFCSNYKIHSIQALYRKELLKRLLAELTDDDIILTVDPFKIRFLFAKCDKHFIAYGPYCTELLSLEEISLLLSHLQIKNLEANTLSKIRGAYYVKRQQNVQYYLNILLSEVTNNNNVRQCRSYSFEDDFLNDANDLEEKHKSINLVRQHYANEQLLIDSISEGDFINALNAWRILHQAVSYKNIGHTLEIAKISASVTRTLLRIGAIKAGLPAEINDSVSGHSTQIISRARNIDSINIEHERLIKEYCDIITEYKKKKYSTTVLSLKYLIENNYSDPLNLDDMSKELSISNSQLIRLFKKETNTTPIAYLNQIRMQHAANSLIKTNQSIQEISASVGIYDSNYFVKIFKKEFNLTPTAYRKKLWQK